MWKFKPSYFNIMTPKIGLSFPVQPASFWLLFCFYDPHHLYQILSGWITENVNGFLQKARNHLKSCLHDMYISIPR